VYEFFLSNFEIVKLLSNSGLCETKLHKVYNLLPGKATRQVVNLFLALDEGLILANDVPVILILEIEDFAQWH
jgi:hypothetical protein